MVLADPTLVLNRNWIPVDVTTVMNALCKVFDGSARVANPDDYTLHDFDSWAQVAVAPEYPLVRTATLSIPVPEVIVLAKYGEIPKRHLAFSRHNIFKRDGFTCQYCGVKPGSKELTIDHVLPRAQGGVSSWTNCVVACVPCNRVKANRTPDQARMKLAAKPDTPKFSPRMVVARMGVKASWDRFVSEAYWNVELDA